MTAGGTENPNNVTNTFFNTLHLLPKDLMFEHGPPNFLPHAPSDLVMPLVTNKGSLWYLVLSFHLTKAWNRTIPVHTLMVSHANCEVLHLVYYTRIVKKQTYTHNHIQADYIMLIICRQIISV